MSVRAALAILLLSVAALPAAAGVIEVETRIGVGGIHKLNVPTPVEMRIQNRDLAPFVGEAAVHPNDLPECRRRILVPPEGECRVVFQVVLTEATYNIASLVFDAGGRAVHAGTASANQHERVREGGAFIVVLDRYGARPDPDRLDSRDRVATGGPELIPSHPDGLAAANAVLVGDVDPGAFSDAQLAALRRHAAAGGRLVFYPTGDGAALRSPLFRSLFPGALATPEAAGRVSLALPSGEPGVPGVSSTYEASDDLAVARLAPEGAGVAAVTPEQTDRRVGRGTATHLAFNPFDRALRKGTFPQAFRSLLAGPDRVSLAPLRKVSENAILPRSVRRPEPGFIFVTLFLYILLVGPGNYLFLAARRRKDLLLVTIPGGALAAGLVVFAIVESSRDALSLTRRFDVVYHAGAGEPAFVASTLSRFSSLGESFNVELPRETVVAPMGSYSFHRNQYAEMLEGARAVAAESGVAFGPVKVERYSGAIFHAAAFLEGVEPPAEFADFKSRPRREQEERPGNRKRSDKGKAGDREVGDGRARFRGPAPGEAWLVAAAGVRRVTFGKPLGDGWVEATVGAHDVTPSCDSPDWGGPVARDLVGTGLLNQAKETGPLLVIARREGVLPLRATTGGEIETLAFHVFDCPLAAGAEPAVAPRDPRLSPPAPDGGDDF